MKLKATTNFKDNEIGIDDLISSIESLDRNLNQFKEKITQIIYQTSFDPQKIHQSLNEISDSVYSILKDHIDMNQLEKIKDKLSDGLSDIDVSAKQLRNVRNMDSMIKSYSELKSSSLESIFSGFEFPRQEKALGFLVIYLFITILPMVFIPTGFPQVLVLVWFGVAALITLILWKAFIEDWLDKELEKEDEQKKIRKSISTLSSSLNNLPSKLFSDGWESFTKTLKSTPSLFMHLSSTLINKISDNSMDKDQQLEESFKLTVSLHVLNEVLMSKLNK